MNQKTSQPETPDVAEIQKMSQPIDVSAIYEIPGTALVQLYALIDEVPMKYARAILPVVAMNITKTKKRA